MLVEASTTEISQQLKPETFETNKEVARKGGNVAKAARVQLEETTGKTVVTSIKENRETSKISKLNNNNKS
ncbi:MAG: hypothetical protein RR646_01830 [Erysipelotrichaceae bacterium]